MLYGTTDSEPQDIVLAQLAHEFYNTNMLLLLIHNLHRIDFEVGEYFLFWDLTVGEIEWEVQRYTLSLLPWQAFINIPSNLRLSVIREALYHHLPLITNYFFMWCGPLCQNLLLHGHLLSTTSYPLSVQSFNTLTTAGFLFYFSSSEF